MAAVTKHLGPPPGLDDRDEAVWRLAAIVESSSNAILSKDLGGVVTSWNRAAERLFGYTAAEMIGRPITTIFPPDRVNEEAAILARIGRGEQVDRYETIRRHREGRDIHVSLTISPIKDANGRIIGASKIIHDLTERQAQEGRIRELQSQLANVQRLTELRQVLLVLAHEVAQPLAAIANYLSALRRLLVAGKQEQVAEGLKGIGEEADRAAQIVERYAST
jgi:two-component system sensor kinase FixL